MARFDDAGDICFTIFTVTMCVLAILLVTHWVWGPKSPPKPFNAKQEFSSNCTDGDRRMVPNVGSENPKEWTCINKTEQ